LSVTLAVVFGLMSSSFTTLPPGEGADLLLWGEFAYFLSQRSRDMP
jgi:hypothetical protein